MVRFILRRLILLVPVMLVVGIMTFTLVHLTPGDPAVVILGPDASLAEVERLRSDLGLDQPLPVQFWRWIEDVVRLDFGQSLFLGRPVTEALINRAEVTGLLTLYSVTLSILIGVPAGVIAAVKRGSIVDRALMVVAISGAAIPSFFLAILLILLFAVTFGILPAGGYVNIGDDPMQHFKAMAMPTFSLGFAHAGLLARLVRSSMLDVMGEDFIRTARAKGLSSRTVINRHALRNALIPVVTVIGYSLGGALGGAVVTETVYSLPGMGRLVVQSVARRDFPVIQGAVITIAAFYVLANLLVDVLYVFIDPRISYDD